MSAMTARHRGGDLNWSTLLLGVMTLVLTACLALATTSYYPGSQNYSQSQIQSAFSNSSNSYIANNSGYFAGMSTFESGGNTGITNGTTTGIMQMTSQNIYNTTGMTPAEFSQQSAQFQANAYSTYFGNVMNEGAEQELLQKQANGETVGGQQVTTGMIVGCAQLGNTHCQQQIDSDCGSKGADGNGTTLCKFANQADANAAKGGYTGKNSNSTNSNNSSTPSNPSRTNPCTCPGNHQGTDAELMKEACPTNTSSVQNWPNTNTYYLGSPPAKVAVGTNICDPSAPSRVPDNFTPVSGATSTPTNTSNTANSSTSGGTGSGTNSHGGTVANLSNAQAAAGSGSCLGQNCQCAALVQSQSNVGSTTSWVRGDQVAGATDLQSGTVIATFNGSDGGYNTAQIYGAQHTAIYLGQDSSGIQVLDQYNSSGGVQERTIPYGSGLESAGKFYVVTH